ncbi:MAG: indolepyruvate oxidoreductase subunit beta family protein [Rhodobacteraceae bacterium]|nr:indolepyruvate oxidoreductase subunit beta family protein [Paracoccaceae bacterium]
MTRQGPVPAAGTAGVIKLAIMAVGGQGGGVLTGWIEDLARANGHACQATSVAGVSQRTGATMYYIEMAPAGERTPVFALMPAAGDVDILIAAEWMEAGRAIIRGFVTPDRTVLIASTHRIHAVSEKAQPGDGIAPAEEVAAAARVAARAVIAADFDAAAVAEGSVISAALFGGLAAAGVLPFPRAAFEAAIRGSGGRGAEASLRAFAAGFEAALAGAAAEAGGSAAAGAGAGAGRLRAVRGPARLVAEWDRLAARAAALPAPVAGMAAHGLRKVVDFQDPAYGADYLGRLDSVLARDDPAQGWLLTREAARHIANAMAYDDVIGVADRKTRGQRFARIRAETGAAEGALVRVTEYFHPRAEEIVGLFPAGLGARIAASPRRMDRIGRWFGRGRRVRSDGVAGFLLLHALAGLRGWRRRTLRHAGEVAHLEAWLDAALDFLPDYGLAVEAIRARRLVKGYSDTHARGLGKFDRVLEGMRMVRGREDAADWGRRLIAAALKDEEGKALDGALATVRSFL